MFGAPAALHEDKDPDCFLVMEENWPAICVFLRCQTQWIIGGSGSPIGLSYPSVESDFRIYGVKNRRKIMDDIREIERGALEAINREKK